MTDNVKTMEIKKAQSATVSKADEAARMASAVDFVGDVKEELKKISWTSREELIVYTKIVVAMTFIMGMGIYLVDILIQNFLHGLSTLFHWFS